MTKTSVAPQFRRRSRFTSNLSCIAQLTEASPTQFTPTSPRAYVKMHGFEILLDVLLVDQSIYTRADAFFAISTASFAQSSAHQSWPTNTAPCIKFNSYAMGIPSLLRLSPMACPVELAESAHSWDWEWRWSRSGSGSGSISHSIRKLVMTNQHFKASRDSLLPVWMPAIKGMSMEREQEYIALTIMSLIEGYELCT